MSLKQMQQLDKPLKLSVEEYMQTLGLPEAGLNGTTAQDLYNVISKPKHYMLFEDQKIEVRDVIGKLLDKLADNRKGEFYSYQFAADYVQLLQYIMRFMDKNGQEDLKKARWYLDKMIENY